MSEQEQNVFPEVTEDEVQYLASPLDTLIASSKVLSGVVMQKRRYLYVLLAYCRYEDAIRDSENAEDIHRIMAAIVSNVTRTTPFQEIQSRFDRLVKYHFINFPPQKISMGNQQNMSLENLNTKCLKT
jgi:hypothetical protein